MLECLCQSCTEEGDMERELCLEKARLCHLDWPVRKMVKFLSFKILYSNRWWHGAAIVKKLGVNLEEKIVDGSEAFLLLPLLSDGHEVVCIDECSANLPFRVAFRIRCCQFPDGRHASQLLSCLYDGQAV